MNPLVALIPSLVLASSGPASGGEENLLANASFEEGGKSPKGWEKGSPVPGVEYLVDGKVAAEGKRSLALRKTVERYFPIAEWEQELAHDGRAAKVHFGALVKAEKAHKAILDVQFEDRAGEWSHAWAAYVGAREAGGEPAHHDWMWYSGVVAVPAGTEKLYFALQIYGPGEVWFDRARAVFVDAATETTDAPRTGPRPAGEWGALPAARDESTSSGGESAERMTEAGSGAPLTLRGDPMKRYILVGPRAAEPAEGYRLLVVLPGGDGSADFQPFVREIAENALPGSYLVAQAIAPAWSSDEERVVWPTRKLEGEKAKFSSEDFVAEIVADVKQRHRIDPRYVFLLGWSSGGPPVYAASLEKGSPVRGALVAMSVFKPEHIETLDGARGRAFYVLHSPEDFIAMDFPKRAVKDLAKKGAKTVLETYAGGHGWHGDVYGMIAKGVSWLEESVRD
jgi:predicted esterase